MEPVDVHISNMAQSGTLIQRYQPVLPLPALSRVPTWTRKTATRLSEKVEDKSSSSIETSSSLLRSVAHVGLQNQVESVESIYRKTVRQLERLAHTACAQAAP